jgi:hypothetical protein
VANFYRGGVTDVVRLDEEIQISLWSDLGRDSWAMCMGDHRSPLFLKG